MGYLKNQRTTHCLALALIMKGLTSILFFSVSSLFYSVSPSNDIECKITPGKGLNELKIGQESPKGKLSFADYEFTKSDGKSLACGGETSLNQYWERYYCKELGITIEYNSESFLEGTKLKNKKLLLTKIRVYENNKVCSDNLCIGSSSYKDVAAIYGPIPSDWKNERFLKFDDKGISFRFDHSSTLFEIEIFEPKR